MYVGLISYLAPYPFAHRCPVLQGLAPQLHIFDAHGIAWRYFDIELAKEGFLSVDFHLADVSPVVPPDGQLAIRISGERHDAVVIALIDNLVTVGHLPLEVVQSILFAGSFLAVDPVDVDRLVGDKLAVIGQVRVVAYKVAVDASCDMEKPFGGRIKVFSGIGSPDVESKERYQDCQERANKELFVCHIFFVLVGNNLIGNLLIVAECVAALANGCRLMIGVVAEDDRLSFMGGLFHQPDLLIVRAGGMQVISGDPGGREGCHQRDHVTRENVLSVLSLDVGDDLPRRVAVEEAKRHLGINRSLLVDQAQPAGGLDCRHVLQKIGVGFQRVWLQEVFPLPPADPMRRVREGHDQFPVRSPGRITAVIEMQMSQHHVGDFLCLDALVRQCLAKIDQVEETIVGKAFELFLTRSVIDQDESPIVRTDKSYTHGKGTSVIIVAWVTAAPCQLRNSAEHGASIGVKETGIDQFQIHNRSKFVDKGIDKI